MIPDIEKLVKTDDILNAEGTLLGLHKHKGMLYLGSSLTDGSGTIYFSVERPTLQRYFRNEINLHSVYLATEDLLVPRHFQGRTVYSSKKDHVRLIAGGDKLFSENSKGVRNDKLALRMLSEK